MGLILDECVIIAPYYNGYSMKKKCLLLIICALSGISFSQAQNSIAANEQAYRPKAYLGFGTGNVYGGVIGVNLAYEPVKGLGLSAGVGYYLSGLGYNGMLYYRFLADKKVNPVVYGLFGTNSVIKVVGAAHYNKVYTGPGAGIGSFFKVGRNANRIFVGLQYAFWSDKFEEDMNTVKNDPAINVKRTPAHVGLNVGFSFSPRKR